MTTVIQEDFRSVFTQNPVAGFLKDGAGTPPVKLARNIRTGLDQWDTKLVKQRTLPPGATFHVRVSYLNPESHVRTPLECQLSGRLELREMSQHVPGKVVRHVLGRQDNRATLNRHAQA